MTLEKRVIMKKIAQRWHGNAIASGMVYFFLWEKLDS